MVRIRPPDTPQSISDQDSIFVGREREIQRLERERDFALEGRGRVVLIGGEAGIGKTSLAEHVLEQPAQAPMHVAIGRCYGLAVSPTLGPWIEILRQLRGDASSDNFSEEAVDTASSEQILNQLRATLSDYTGGTAIALLLDDLQWADQSSLDVLQLLSPVIAQLPVLLVVTYRDDELTRSDPLYTLLPQLLRESHVGRIELQSLDGQAISQWIETIYRLAKPDQSRLVEQVLRLSDGNPFFAGELLRTFEDHGVLHATDRGWDLGDIDQFNVPLLLQQVIETRLQRLTEDEREYLSTAAVIGQEFSITLWQRIVEAEEVALSAAIDRALEANLIHETDAGTLKFRHALIRETLYEQFSPLRRQIAHREVADALIESSPLDADRIAYHLRQAHDERETEWATQAGDQAWRRLARLTAAEYFTRALSLVERTPDVDLTQGWLQFRIAECYRLANPRQSLSHLDAAADVADATGNNALAALTAFSRGMTLCLLDHPQGPEILIAGDQALDALSDSERDDIQQRVGLDVNGRKGDVATWLAALGYYQDALRTAEHYLADSSTRGLSRRRTEADAWDAIGVVQAVRGHPNQARRSLREAARHFEEIGNYYSAGSSLWEDLVQVALVYYPEDIDTREQLAEQMHQYWRQAQTGQVALHPAWSFTPLLYLEGRWDEARASALKTLNSEAWSVGPLIYLALIARHRANYAEARARVAQGLPDGFETEPGTGVLYNQLALIQVAAHLAFDEGEIDEAERWLAAYERLITWSQRVIGRSDLAELKARMALETGNIDRAREHAWDALEHALNPRQPLRVIATLTRLTDVHTRLDSPFSDEHIERAIRYARDSRAIYPLARALVVKAHQLIKSGRYHLARPALREAQELTQLLGAKRIQGQADKLTRVLDQFSPTDALPGGLTARELEVLQLVAEGLTDADVAARLEISRRTVSNHLRSIFLKINVSSRTAATRYAAEHELI